MKVIQILNNPDNDKSVFVWGHYGQKLESLDKDRFQLLAQDNPHISLARLYNKNMNKLIKEIEEIKNNGKDKETKKVLMEEVLVSIEEENSKDKVFREVNKLMLRFGDSVSFGSLVTGQFESQTKHGKMVKHKEKVNIE